MKITTLVPVVFFVSSMIVLCHFAVTLPDITLKQQEFSHLPAEVVSGSASRLSS